MDPDGVKTTYGVFDVRGFQIKTNSKNARQEQHRAIDRWTVYEAIALTDTRRKNVPSVLKRRKRYNKNKIKRSRNK